jgi:hypothetical protein
MDIVVEDLKAYLLFSSVDYVPVDAERLQNLYRQTKNAISKTFNFPNKIAVGDIGGIKEA